MDNIDEQIGSKHQMTNQRGVQLQGRPGTPRCPASASPADFAICWSRRLSKNDRQPSLYPEKSWPSKPVEIMWYDVVGFVGIQLSKSNSTSVHIQKQMLEYQFGCKSRLNHVVVQSVSASWYQAAEQILPGASRIQDGRSPIWVA